jgi:hypothetical protein
LQRAHLLERALTQVATLRVKDGDVDQTTSVRVCGRSRPEAKTPRSAS